MFTEILVGVDGQQGGRDAIALAGRLADPDASTTLVHVFGAGLTLGRGSELLASVELECSQQLLERERETRAPAAAPLVCTDRSVGHALHVLAERHGADLIVIGACRHGFLGRVLLGDDTIAALNGAPCAVAIAPFEYAKRAQPFCRIGVGYDGSPESERALAMARALAPRWRSTVEALAVISLESIPYGEPIAKNWPDAAKQLMDDRRRHLRNLNDVEGDVTYGDPTKELVSLSKQVDLLVVGSRGYGPLARLVHGSTSNQLARRARGPLLVLPRDGVDEECTEWGPPFEVEEGSPDARSAPQAPTRPWSRA